MDKYLKEIKNIIGNNWNSVHNEKMKFYYANMLKAQEKETMGFDEDDNVFWYSLENIYYVAVNSKKVKFKTFLNSIKLLKGEK